MDHQAFPSAFDQRCRSQVGITMLSTIINKNRDDHYGAGFLQRQSVRQCKLRVGFRRISPSPLTSSMSCRFDPSYASSGIPSCDLRLHDSTPSLLLFRIKKLPALSQLPRLPLCYSSSTIALGPSTLTSPPRLALSPTPKPFAPVVCAAGTASIIACRLQPNPYSETSRCSYRRNTH